MCSCACLFCIISFCATYLSHIYSRFSSGNTAVAACSLQAETHLRPVRFSFDLCCFRCQISHLTFNISFGLYANMRGRVRQMTPDLGKHSQLFVFSTTFYKQFHCAPLHDGIWLWSQIVGVWSGTSPCELSVHTSRPSSLASPSERPRQIRDFCKLISRVYKDLSLTAHAQHEIARGTGRSKRSERFSNCTERASVLPCATCDPRWCMGYSSAGPGLISLIREPFAYFIWMPTIAICSTRRFPSLGLRTQRCYACAMALRGASFSLTAIAEAHWRVMPAATKFCGPHTSSMGTSTKNCSKNVICAETGRKSCLVSPA